MKKIQVLVGLRCVMGFVGCSSFPHTDILITDAAGDPVNDFPLRVELGEGITWVENP